MEARDEQDCDFSGQSPPGRQHPGLAGGFAAGARGRHQVELCSVADYLVHPCTGCNACAAREETAASSRTICSSCTPSWRRRCGGDCLAGVLLRRQRPAEGGHRPAAHPMRNRFQVKKAGSAPGGGGHPSRRCLTPFCGSTSWCWTTSAWRMRAVSWCRASGRGGDIQGSPALQEAYDLGASL